FGWSPRGSKGETIWNGLPPSDFSGRGGRCGTQVLSWISGRPVSISADSAATVAVTDDADIDSASSRLISRPETGLRPLAARSRAVAAMPIDVPRPDLCVSVAAFFAALPAFVLR